jgi:hypothetical protein
VAIGDSTITLYDRADIGTKRFGCIVGAIDLGISAPVIVLRTGNQNNHTNRDQQDKPCD